MRIAVLALQGAFIEHERMLASLGADVIELRQERDLQNAFDGLVLPGGESTVQGKLLRETGLFEPLRRRIEAGLPVFGTCAGLLLLARRIDNDDRTHFAVMDVAAVRNAYGRQLGSFRTSLELAGMGTVPATFIRAPFVMETGRGVETLATCDGNVVAVKQGKQLALAFHPELDEDTRIHELFLDL